MNRFYMREALQAIDYRDVAGTILFMAGKLGNGKNFQKIEKVIVGCINECYKKSSAVVDTSEGGKVIYCFLMARNTSDGTGLSCI